MPNRKILTPMWIDGDNLYPFGKYREMKMSGELQNVERVWVAVSRHELYVEKLSVSEHKEWIFTDTNAGAIEVRKHNFKIRQALFGK